MAITRELSAKLNEEVLRVGRFGSWTVIGEGPVRINKTQPGYLCRCDCGTERVVSRHGLLNGKTKSCRRCNIPKPGKIFGELKVIEAYTKPYGGRPMHFCRCECRCGKRTDVLLNHLLSENTQSCGCKRNRVILRGADSPRWKGGRHTTKEGYVKVLCRGHSRANPRGYIFEHVLVMAEMIGRPLRSGETVHHRNGIRNDNRPENLELFASRHPAGQRVSDLLAFAREIIEEYGALDLKA